MIVEVHPRCALERTVRNSPPPSLTPQLSHPHRHSERLFNPPDESSVRVVALVLIGEFKNMKEYQTVSIDTIQGWGGAKGSADTKAIDDVLNKMAQDGWELVCLEDLKHSAGSGSLLCVFSRERNP